MNAFETSATVGQEGLVRLIGVPFAPGTEVEVSIIPKRKSAAEFAELWRRVCAQLRGETAQEPSDQEIDQEIKDYRAGR